MPKKRVIVPVNKGNTTVEAVVLRRVTTAALYDGLTTSKYIDGEIDN